MFPLRTRAARLSDDLGREPKLPTGRGMSDPVYEAFTRVKRLVTRLFGSSAFINSANKASFQNRFISRMTRRTDGWVADSRCKHLMSLSCFRNRITSVPRRRGRCSFSSRGMSMVALSTPSPPPPTYHVVSPWTCRRAASTQARWPRAAPPRADMQNARSASHLGSRSYSEASATYIVEVMHRPLGILSATDSIWSYYSFQTHEMPKNSRYRRT